MSEHVVVMLISRHQLNSVWPHGLQLLVLSCFVFSLQFELTSLSGRFLGRLCAIRGNSANILDKRSFDLKDPKSPCTWCVVLGRVPFRSSFSHFEALRTVPGSLGVPFAFLLVRHLYCSQCVFIYSCSEYVCMGAYSTYFERLATGDTAFQIVRLVPRSYEDKDECL